MDEAFHDSVNPQIWPESFRFFFFLISFIFNSLNSETLICMRKPNSVDSKKGRLHDDVILQYQIPSGFCSVFCKLGILLFKPQWDYQI